MSVFDSFIKQDRPWQRAHRIAHAKYQLRIAPNDILKRFWRLVLEENGAEDEV